MAVLLQNMTEKIVLKRLDNLISSIDCCKCDQCRMDIASYALNRLPAKYVATTQGELLSKLDTLEAQFDATVTTTIIKGAMVVKTHPHHKDDQ